MQLCETIYITSAVGTSLVPDPALTRRETGLVTIERYLGCAELSW